MFTFWNGNTHLTFIAVQIACFEHISGRVYLFTVILNSTHLLFIKKSLNSFIISKDNHFIQYLKNILVIHLAKKTKIHYLSSMRRGKHGTDVFRGNYRHFEI